MEMLARGAGYFAIAGGVLAAILVGVVVYDPDTGAWLGFFLVVALLAVFAYAAATNQLNFDATATSDPLTPFWIVTAIAWFLGTIGFGVAIIRARALSAIGGWLVLAGAVAVGGSHGFAVSHASGRRGGGGDTTCRGNFGT